MKAKGLLYFLALLLLFVSINTQSVYGKLPPYIQRTAISYEWSGIHGSIRSRWNVNKWSFSPCHSSMAIAKSEKVQCNIFSIGMSYAQCNKPKTWLAQRSTWTTRCGFVNYTTVNCPYNILTKIYVVEHRFQRGYFSGWITTVVAHIFRLAFSFRNGGCCIYGNWKLKVIKST